MPVTTPPKLHAIFDISASTNDRFRVVPAGATPAFDIVLAAGSGETSGYFIRAHTSGPEAIPTGRTGGSPGAAAGVGAQLVEEIQERIRAGGGANFAAATCAVSDTGIVTITNTAESFSILEHSGGGTAWADTSTGLAQILGYTGTLTPAATSFAAANQHRYGWYPNVPPANRKGAVNRPDIPRSDAVVQVAPSGLVTVRSYNVLRSQTYVFSYLDRERTFIVGSGDDFPNQSLEQFWDDALRTGARLRWYEDRTVQTDPAGNAPWGYVAGKRLATAGVEEAAQVSPLLDELWNVELDLHRFIATPA